MAAAFPEIKSIAAFGGDKQKPPQYGKVFLAIDIEGMDILPDTLIAKYENFLEDRSTNTIEPVFINPSFTYVDVTTRVKYNINNTILNVSEIDTFVRNSIVEYNNESLDNFKVNFRYSKLVEKINNAHESIVSNDTDVLIYKKISPTTGIATNYTLDFDTELHREYVDTTTHTQRS